MVSGGELVAEFLVRQGVPVVFGLCGGHISPIFVAAKQRGIRVVDVRDEASAVFAADAVARLTGVPGVAVVTAGPGVTNTLTALKNAELAQTPVVLLGGAAATILKGRGALQDIDQRRVVGPHVKWAASVRRVRDIVAALTEAFVAAQEEVPGPVFVELPVDVLYAESLVREWYRAGRSGSDAAGVTALFRKWYVDHHLRQVFGGTGRAIPPERLAPEVPRVPPDVVRQVGRLVAAARRPLLLVGSQAMLRPFAAQELTQAVHRIGVPAYCAGMARGLLPRSHRLLMRHERRKALAEADLVMLAGTPADFRLQYGAQINRRATVIAVNRSRREARKNLRPALVALGDVSLFLEHLEPRAEEGRWSEWIDSLAARDAARDAEIAGLADEESAYINPVYLCQAINEALDENSVLVMDGGDFVGTASYIVAPRRPLSFLDPGVFGTLGVVSVGGPRWCVLMRSSGFSMETGPRRTVSPSWTRWCGTGCPLLRWWATTRAGPRSRAASGRCSRTMWPRSSGGATMTVSRRAMEAWGSGSSGGTRSCPRWRKPSARRWPGGRW
jgi:acetolactate synthase-1/2/3 large subunit